MHLASASHAEEKSRRRSLSSRARRAPLFACYCTETSPATAKGRTAPSKCSDVSRATPFPGPSHQPQKPRLLFPSTVVPSPRHRRFPPPHLLARCFSSLAAAFRVIEPHHALGRAYRAVTCSDSLLYRARTRGERAACQPRLALGCPRPTPLFRRSLSISVCQRRAPYTMTEAAEPLRCRDPRHELREPRAQTAVSLGKPLDSLSDAPARVVKGRALRRALAYSSPGPSALMTATCAELRS